MSVMGTIYRFCLFVFLLIVSSVSIADGVVISQGVDKVARLPYWQIKTLGISLRLVQRLPDQSRAYFMARGFSEKHAEIIAQSCVFQTVFRNISVGKNASPVSYNLHDWVVVFKGKKQGMKVREDWKKEWQKRKAGMAAQIAFEWGLFPTHQVYEAGDYNWGMSIFNLKPGSHFNLKVVWQQFGKNHSAWIKNIQCAADIHPE